MATKATKCAHSNMAVMPDAQDASKEVLTCSDCGQTKKRTTHLHSTMKSFEAKHAALHERLDDHRDDHNKLVGRVEQAETRLAELSAKLDSVKIASSE